MGVGKRAVGRRELGMGSGEQGKGRWVLGSEKQGASGGERAEELSGREACKECMKEQERGSRELRGGEQGVKLRRAGS